MKWFLASMLIENEKKLKLKQKQMGGVVLDTQIHAPTSPHNFVFCHQVKNDDTIFEKSSITWYFNPFFGMIHWPHNTEPEQPFVFL